MAHPMVTLLTDFGLRDPSAAICRAVVLGICPEAEVIDLAHDVRKFSILEGARDRPDRDARRRLIAEPQAPLAPGVVAPPGVGPPPGAVAVWLHSP